MAKPGREDHHTRDDFGIAHINGPTDADAIFGMICAQAEDDFPRIEANYLTALGRTAEEEGEEAIWKDLRARLYVSETELKADYANSPDWLKRLMDAWAAKPWRTATVENNTTEAPSTALRWGAAAFMASAAPSALTRQSASKSAAVREPIGFRLMVPAA